MRVLVIAESANPTFVSVPLIGWSISAALRERIDTHLVTHTRNKDAIEAEGWTHNVDFTTINSDRLASPLYQLADKIRGHDNKGWTIVSAANSLSYYYFEYLLWREFGKRIRSGEFDLVHRVTPLTPTSPSLVAAKCRKAGVPFVVGPLNGGLPWPTEFNEARSQEREWLSTVRDVYKLMPGYTATRRDASALIIGSKHTLKEIPDAYKAKCVFMPENGIDVNRFDKPRAASFELPLKLCFVGRLVPYKGADMLLEAIAPLARDGKVTLDIVGDGPQMPVLKQIVEDNGIGNAINFAGWVKHTQVQEHLSNAHVFSFPSIREFGGGVVLEAMALGVVPLIVNYGGPAEVMSPDSGLSVPLGPRHAIVNALQRRITELVDDPSPLAAMSSAARARVKNMFTWQAKAEQVEQVYAWALGRGSKPNFGIAAINA